MPSADDWAELAEKVYKTREYAAQVRRECEAALERELARDRDLYGEPERPTLTLIQGGRDA